LDGSGAAGELLGEVRELEHRELGGVAEVERTIEARQTRDADEAFDEVVHVTEGAGLRAVAENGERLVLEALHDEVRDDAPVVERHAWAIGVEDADDARVDAPGTARIGEEGFGAALAFVVARTRPD